MSMKFLQHLRSYVCALAVFVVGVAHAQQAVVYRIGVVPQFDSRTTLDIWTPIVAELQTRTGFEFKLIPAPSIPVFEQQVAREELDFAYMNPYHYIKAQAHYSPLVRDVKTPLQGIVVVRKDSPVQNLQGLEGKTVDFPAPNALAASLMPRAEFARSGIAITPRYVKSHKSVYMNVVLGQAEAGGGVMQTLDEQSAQVREQLRVVFTTPEVASHPLVVHKRLSTTVQEKVRNAVLEMAATPQGQALWSKVPMDRVGKAAPADYAPIQRLGLEKVYVEN